MIRSMIQNFKLWLQRYMFGSRRPILIIVPLLTLAAVVVVIVLVVTRLSTYSIDEPIYRFENGARYDYEGATEIKRDDSEGAVYLKNGGESVPLESSPIYYSDDADAILLPQQMIYVDPATGRMGRTGYSTLVRVNGAGEDTAIVNGSEVEIGGGFFYDGSNTYVFLEPVTISWSGRTIELEPLSYAVVYYNLRLELYSPEGGALAVEQTGDARVQATSGSGKYSLDLGTDVLTSSSGESLLTSRPDLFKYLT
jgi:hypothetical protein